MNLPPMEHKLNQNASDKLPAECRFRATLEQYYAKDFEPSATESSAAHPIRQSRCTGAEMPRESPRDSCLSTLLHRFTNVRLGRDAQDEGVL